MGLKRFIMMAVLTFCVFALKAQNVQQIVEAYSEYQTNWPLQKLHFSFNQDKYAPGDTVFFKTYLLTSNLSLWSGSQVIEVNLLDSQGDVQVHAKIKTQDGTGSNQLILPDDLEAGFYNFTAFTNWMRNFEVEKMFAKPLTVVKDKQIALPKEGLKVGIEGGNLIEGVLTNIVVKSPDSNSIIYLLDQNEGVLDSVETDANGFGKLKLVSKSGTSYWIEDKEGQISLPKVKMAGYNLSLTLPENSTDDLKILISAKPELAGNSNLSLIITSKGTVVYSEDLPSNQNKIGKSISRDRLTSGLYQVSLLNDNSELVSFREFYLNRNDDEGILVSISEEEVAPRQPIDIEFKVDNQGGSTNNPFSVSVVNAQTNSSLHLNLEESITLQGRLDFARINDYSDKPTLIDNQLILHPKPIKWEHILNSSNTKPSHGYSTLFQLVGEARDSTNQLLPDNSIMMFYLQHDLMRYEVKILTEGKFVLNLLDIYGEDELFVMAETPEGKEVLDVKINWIEQPMPSFQKAPEAILLNGDDPYATYSAKRRKVNHSFQYFSSEVNLDSLAEMNKNRVPKVPILEADHSFNVADFYLFPTLGEFINEVVRPLRVAQQKGKPLIRVRYLEPDITLRDPLYILDGIATKNTEFLLSLDPKIVETIEVIKLPKKLSRFGLMAKNGIVIVNTKSGNVREPINPNLMIKGLNRPLDFPVLQPEWVAQINDPSFRSTVYWNSNVEIDQDGNGKVLFYTSDDVAPLQVRVEGFLNGTPVTAIKRLSIKD